MLERIRELLAERRVVPCGRCGGTGRNARGHWCWLCSGSGKVRKDRRL